ncbi:MAG TPA: protein kinase [Trebonia sp.]|nr:protein kinase [Trebonia sp.]
MESENVLTGRYRLDERLGRGASGEVWRGHDLKLSRPVAIKVLRDADPDKTMRKRFHREAATAAGLQHPCITVVYDFDEHDGRMFIVTELLRGEDLGKVLAAFPDGLAVSRALDFGIQLADALIAAHAKGIVHRDLKPANIFIQHGERLKVCDFGLARDLNSTSSLSMTGDVIGTPAYMAPEQWLGPAASPSVDLYALGCIMHEMLTGQPPFTGPGLPVVMHQHLTETPAATRDINPEVPEPLSDLVSALMAKDAASRPGNADDIRAAFAAISTDLYRERLLDQLTPTTVVAPAGETVTAVPSASTGLAPAAPTAASATPAAAGPVPPEPAPTASVPLTGQGPAATEPAPAKPARAETAPAETAPAETASTEGRPAEATPPEATPAEATPAEGRPAPVAGPGTSPESLIETVPVSGGKPLPAAVPAQASEPATALAPAPRISASGGPSHPFQPPHSSVAPPVPLLACGSPVPGLVEVYAPNKAGGIRGRLYSEASAGGASWAWSDWESTSLPADPVSALAASGGYVIGVVDGNPWISVQGKWAPVHLPAFRPAVADVAIAATPSGPGGSPDPELFILDVAGGIWHEGLAQPFGPAIPGPAERKPTAIAAASNGNDLALISVASGVFCKSRIRGSNWSGWREVGGRRFPVEVVTCSSLRNRFEVFALSRGGRIWLSASRPQTVGGAPVWSEWTRVAGPPGRVATVSASAIVGRVGVLVAVTTDGISHYAHYERMPGGQFDDLEWSAWSRMP